MAHLGHMYANGQGVAQSNETALQWFTRSSDAGHPSGMYGLGYMYVSGQGVLQDHRRAFELFEDAAKQVSLPSLTTWGAIPDAAGCAAQQVPSFAVQSGPVLLL